MLASNERRFAPLSPPSYRTALRQYDNPQGHEVRILTPTSVRRKPEPKTEKHNEVPTEGQKHTVCRNPRLCSGDPDEQLRCPAAVNFEGRFLGHDRWKLRFLAKFAEQLGTNFDIGNPLSIPIRGPATGAPTC